MPGHIALCDVRRGEGLVGLSVLSWCKRLQPLGDKTKGETRCRRM